MTEIAASNAATGHSGEAGATLAELLNTSDKTAQGYLSHLTTLPLKTLKTEPSILQTQAHHLTSSLTSLTHTSYSTFLSLHSTTSALTESLGSLSSSLDTLLTISLPALEESAAGWRDLTDTVLAERQKARVVLEEHDKLRDLLDIPILIDTCVRNGYFAEALSFASRAKSLSFASTSTPMIFKSILSEVQNSLSQMLLSLLTTLHEPNRKLPALYKAVTYLRRLDAFQSEIDVHSEEQIALSFLGGREACLKAMLAGTQRDIERLVGAGGDLPDRDKEDIARYLERYIDTWREGVYNIITQFTTIFLERSADATTQVSPDAIPALRIMLSTYASKTLHSHLIPVLSFTLPNVPVSLMQKLLNQMTYCTTAFGRVGFDFRGTLDGLFSNAILAAVSSEMKRATVDWIKVVRSNLGSTTELLTPMTSTLKKKSFTPPSKFLLAAPVSSPPLPSASSTPTSAANIAPQILAAYPPLAQYTNSLLTTFNSFRQLAPISIFPELQSTLDASLTEAGHLLVLYIKRVFGDGGSRHPDDKEQEQEERIAFATGKVYFIVFVPFLRRALGEGLYGVKRDYGLLSQSEEGDVSKLSVLAKEFDAWLEAKG